MLQPEALTAALGDMRFLLYGACNLGEDVVRLAANEFDGGYDDDQKSPPALRHIQQCLERCRPTTP